MDGKLKFKEFFKNLDHWIMKEKADVFVLWSYDSKNIFYQEKKFVSEIGEDEFYQFLDNKKIFPNG